MSSPAPPEGPLPATLAAAERLRVIRAGLNRVQSQISPTELDLTEVVRQEIARVELSNENERTLTGLRKSYGQNMIRFLWAYFVVALSITIFGSLGVLHVSDNVEIALIGGTAVSVLGVVGTTVAGLFQIKSSSTKN